MVHSNITCSTVLLNDDGEVRISMQKHCMTISKEEKLSHSDVQAVEDIMMQLLKKCRKGNKLISANNLCH